jgi:hypothetical protein
MTKIHIVTVATKPGGYLKWLEESCLRNGTKLTILGMGSEWRGYISKILLVNDFLKTIDKQDIVCFVDAYDALMLKNVDILMEKFLKITENTNYKMICGSDLFNFYDITILNKIMKKCRDHHYKSEEDYAICAGTFIGYVFYLEEVFNWMIEIYNTTGNHDDQILLNEYYNFNRQYIYIDNNYDIFKTDIMFNKNDGKSEDYVFIHRPGNQEMISLLHSHNYKINIYDYIVLFNDTVNVFKDKCIYHHTNILKTMFK